MAPYIEGVFDSTTHPIMGCYYEFARRYPLPMKRGDVGEGGERVGAGTTVGEGGGAVDETVAEAGAGAGTVDGAAAKGAAEGTGRFQGLFQGFIPASADKIFESTYEKKT
jgi:hypothetical protein